MGELNEILITKAIIERYMAKLLDNIETDVALVGAGPASLVAGYYLAKAGVKTTIFEKKLSIGGGIWGGGMLFNEIVVQEAGKSILDEIGVRTEKFDDDYYTADAVELATTLGSKAVQAGVNIFNAIYIEDVQVRQIDGEYRVTGLVINWTPVALAHLHVDPLVITSKFVVDGTGHDAEVAKILQDKMGFALNTPTGKIMGEKSMWAHPAEEAVPENTREIFPGVYAIGMAANAVFGSHRMGPIFGGMLLSGKKVAQLIIDQLNK